jgi:Domain of unknown function (DUF4177)
MTSSWLAYGVQRYEYKVVSFADGGYTSSLNEYGRDGWELVSVASDVRVVPARAERKLPMPRALEQLEGVASKWGGDGGDAGPPPGSITTTLLWVLRRPLADD